MAAGVATALRIAFDRGRPMAGIDVGEDFLDLAILDKKWRRLTYRRVALDGIGAGRAPLAELRARIGRVLDLKRGAIAIIDSPRWPRDLALPGSIGRADGVRGRAIDARLRTLVAAVATDYRAVGRLAMFPTPPLDYFLRCCGDPRCKPHLASLGRAMFYRFDKRGAARAASVSGGLLFTRFMIVGFAVYRALDTAGIETFESFPDLQFRLSSPRLRLPPKSRGRMALDVRRRIVARLARRIGVEGGPPATIDSADAAVLVLGAAAASAFGTLLQVSAAAEGRFVVGLASAQARAAAAAIDRG